jgi:hypothetical protein
LTKKLKRQIQKLLRDYDRGLWTWHNLVSNISDFALSDGFFDYMRSLSPEIVEGLTKIALQAPSHPEDVQIIASYCGPWPNPAWEKALDDDRLRCYWSAKKLREFLFPGLPIPPFEPVKRIGKVEESVRDGESVVLFGKFEGWMIRKHPVFCVTPSADKIRVTVTSVGFVKRTHEDSTEPFKRQHGRFALTLDGTRLRPEQIPAGSEVLVDRTEATVIPNIEPL